MKQDNVAEIGDFWTIAAKIEINLLKLIDYR